MNEQMTDLANRITRSTVAVLDTMASRGAFRGEELSTIGQLRDQCIQLVQLLESQPTEPRVADEPLADQAE